MGFAVLMPVLVFVIVLIFCTILHARCLCAWKSTSLGLEHPWREKRHHAAMKTIVYGMTPSLAFGWIPFIGFLFGIWLFVLDIIGVRELGALRTVKKERS